MKKLYRGFSTQKFIKDKTFKLYDSEVVKEDLTRHIFTSLRSRPFIPRFGTRLSEIVFSQLDQDTIDEITIDIQTVFDSDPRIEVLELDIIPNLQTGTVLIAAVLNYIELDLTERFDLNLQLES